MVETKILELLFPKYHRSSLHPGGPYPFRGNEDKETTTFCLKPGIKSLRWRTLQVHHSLGEADNLGVCYHLCLTYRDLCIWPWPCVSSFTLSILLITSSRSLSQSAKTQTWWGRLITVSCAWGKNESLHRLGEGRVQTWVGFVWYWFDFFSSEAWNDNQQSC